MGIVYDAAPEGQILMFQMWKVKNESVLTITYVNGGDISTFGGTQRSLLSYYPIFFDNIFPLHAILNSFSSDA